MKSSCAERLYNQIQEQVSSNLTTIEKGRAFLEWVLYNVFDKVESELEDDEIKNGKGVMICDGSGDKGIDAAFVNNGSLHIIQTKFNTSHSEDEVYAFIIKMGKILKKQVDSLRADYNSIYDLIFDEDSSINDIQFFYITDNDINATIFENVAKDFEEIMPEHCSKSCRMKIMGISEIVDYRDEIANSIPQKYKGKTVSLVLEKFFENKQQDTIVAEVSLKSIAQLVKNNKEYLFYSNIRNFLNSTKINKSMIETFKDKPTSFWHYNNGVTIVCDDYNRKNDTLIEITTPQIVNGCQTVSVIYTQWDALKKDREKQNSLQGTILVKIIRDTNNKRIDITRYTNSQNAVTGKDFFALDRFHRNLKKDFANLGYNYEIQRNSDVSKELKYKIKGNPKYAYLFDKLFKKNYTILAKEAVQAYASGILLCPAKAKSIGNYLPNGQYYNSTFNDKTPTDPRFYLFPYAVMHYGKNILEHKKDDKQKASNLFFVSLYFRLINRALFKTNILIEDTYNFLDIEGSIEILDKIFSSQEINVKFLDLSNDILFEQIYDDTGIKDMIGDNLPKFLKSTIEQEKCVKIINDKIDNRLSKPNIQPLLTSVNKLFQV